MWNFWKIEKFYNDLHSSGKRSTLDHFLHKGTLSKYKNDYNSEIKSNNIDVNFFVSLYVLYIHCWSGCSSAFFYANGAVCISFDKYTSLRLMQVHNLTYVVRCTCYIEFLHQWKQWRNWNNFLVRVQARRPRQRVILGKVKTSPNINSTFGEGTASELRRWFQKFQLGIQIWKIFLEDTVLKVETDSRLIVRKIAQRNWGFTTQLFPDT